MEKAHYRKTGGELIEATSAATQCVRESSWNTQQMPACQIPAQ
jgi:hypothetical protein